MGRSVGMGYLPTEDLDAFARLLRQGEQDWGYDTVWLPDERFYYDVYAIMAVAAMTTTRMRIGSAVTDPYSRHPSQTARGMATVDRFSGGRAILGIGAGVSGLREMGIVQEKPVRWTRECIELCRALWQGGVVDYHGSFVQFHSGKLDFPSRPDIPVFIAARAPLMAELAGQMADGVIFGGLSSPRTLQYGFGRLHKGAARAGRDPGPIEKMVWAQTFIHKDARLAREASRWMVAVQLRAGRQYLPEMGVDVSDAVLDKLQWNAYHLSPENIGPAARHVPDEVISDFALAGDPDMVGRQVEEIFAAGVDHVGLLTWQVGDQTPAQGLELFGREVLPHLGRRQ